jgi:hypothetical protein
MIYSFKDKKYYGLVLHNCLMIPGYLIAFVNLKITSVNPNYHHTDGNARCASPRCGSPAGSFPGTVQ